jgi:hypothetical protein
VTFPEIESILSAPTGEQYWQLVRAFPSKAFVLEVSEMELTASIRQSTAKRISDKRVAYLDFWEGHLQYFVKAILSTNGILCQILIETTQIPQVLINLLLNIGRFTIEHKLRLC